MPRTNSVSQKLVREAMIATDLGSIPHKVYHSAASSPFGGSECCVTTISSFISGSLDDSERWR